MTYTEKLNSVFDHSQNFYGSTILNPSTLVNIATATKTWEEILDFHGLLASDEYVSYLDAYYRECIHRYKEHWHHLDITNILYTASKTLNPRNYLEIGVRRGRSVCIVARGCPEVDITAFDMWIANYANMENPGPAFVSNELISHGHKGSIEFIDGDSHQTVPYYFSQNPDKTFDLITVDGDHSPPGAMNDLCNVIPHLSIGGIVVFDDISHPSHPYLIKVWQKALELFPFLIGYEFTEMGYGVAFAIRRD